MAERIVRLEFDTGVGPEQIEDLVAVAIAAAEGIAGATALRLESPLAVFLAERAVEVDDSAEGGRGIARALVRLAERSLGAGALSVRRVVPRSPTLREA